MRNTVVFCIILFFGFYSFGQEKTIRLNLEEGKTYVFGYESKLTSFDRNGNSLENSVSSGKFAFSIEKINREKVIFYSKDIKGKNEKIGNKARIIYDNEFPPIIENINHTINNNYRLFNSLLNLVDLKFELDLKQNSLKQIEKNTMFEQMDSILTIKGYNQESISEFVDFVSNDTIFMPRIIASKNLFLYFNGATKINQNEIWSPFLNNTYTRSGIKNEFISGENKKTPGIVFERIQLNDKYGIISSYYKTKSDTATSHLSNSKSKITEVEYSFIGEYETQNKQVTFRCTIDNPKDSIVTLFVMDKPFGENLTRIFLKLDRNNSIFFQALIPDQSLFLFATKELKWNTTNADFVFYSEPGDTVDLKITETENNRNVHISGTRKVVNEVLYNLQNSTALFLPVSFSAILEKDGTSFLGYPHAESSVKNFYAYLEKNNINLEKHIHTFIENELLAIQYFNYFSFLKLENYTNIDQLNPNYIKERKFTIQMIEDFDIHDIYNDYGLYSRQLSSFYLQYYLNNLFRVSSYAGTYYNESCAAELNQAKLILGGSVLYRVMASRIVNSMAKNYSIFSYTTRYDRVGAMQVINNLVNQCFDAEYLDHLNEFRDRSQDWTRDSYFPKDIFYKENGNKTTLEECLIGKPTVFYVSTDWGRDRYFLDDLAKKNPAIRFVYVVEGNSFEYWKKYLERAEPVAEQLILINNQTKLADIFIRSSNNFIVYDKNGKLLGFDVRENEAIKLAKDSLVIKKELNKGQLQFIIILLAVILTALIIGLTIWKWRVRQRFRKEEQNRKLRELELTAIRLQMNPHFLFNALNSVQNLVQQNKGREAHLYLADFAGLIRKVLNNSEKEEVSLAEELEMIEQYLNLEKLRFDFEFKLSVSDEIDSHNTLVPSMLLQPFVENAVIHGLQSKDGNKQLKVEIAKSESGIKVTIEDNGIGRKAAKQIAKAKNGKGTKLMKERLEILQEKQGEKYSLQIVDLEEGTRVEIVIPEEN